MTHVLQKDILIGNKDSFEKMGITNKTPLAAAILAKTRNIK
jgi:hypothetical protein